MNKNVTWYKQRLDRGLPIFFNGGQKTNSKQKSSSSSPGWRLAVWMLNPSSGHWPHVYLPQPRSQYIYGALTVGPSKHPDLLRSSLSKNSIRNTLNDKKKYNTVKLVTILKNFIFYVSVQNGVIRILHTMYALNSLQV